MIEMSWRQIKMEKQAQPKKPKLRLAGTNGNAFAILAMAKRAAVKAGWNQAQIKELMDVAMASDYDGLLVAICERFDVS